MDEVAPEDAAPTEAPPSQLFPLGLRILVVDDDPVCLSAVEKMLRRCGYAGARARPHPFCHSPPLKLRDGTENRHYFYGDFSDSLRHRARSDDGKQRRRCACDYSEQCGMFWCAIAPLAGTRDIMPIHRGSLRQTHSPADLVLSDVSMPDIDGLRLMELIGLEMGLPVISASREAPISGTQGWVAD